MANTNRAVRIFWGIKPTGWSRWGRNCPSHSDGCLNCKCLHGLGVPVPLAGPAQYLSFLYKAGDDWRACLFLRRPNSTQLPFGTPLLKPVQISSLQSRSWPVPAAVGSEQSLFFIRSIPSPPRMSYLFNIPGGTKHTLALSLLRLSTQMALLEARQ